jgi:hypothetical protein
MIMNDELAQLQEVAVATCLLQIVAAQADIQIGYLTSPTQAT